MGTFNLRLDEETHKKIQFISQQQSRSQNKQVEFIVRQFIADYERINGKIEIDEETETVDYRTRSARTPSIKKR